MRWVHFLRCNLQREDHHSHLVDNVKSSLNSGEAGLVPPIAARPGWAALSPLCHQYRCLLLPGCCSTKMLQYQLLLIFFCFFSCRPYLPFNITASDVLCTSISCIASTRESPSRVQSLQYCWRPAARLCGFLFFARKKQDEICSFYVAPQLRTGCFEKSISSYLMGPAVGYTHVCSHELALCRMLRVLIADVAYIYEQQIRLCS